MSQFLNTIKQIVQCDSVGPFYGVCRHLHWQIRKALHRFPCELPIGESRLYVDEPGGVAALVNAMGEYDYNNMQLLKLVLNQGSATFIDVGANIGSYTLIASQIREAAVVSVEPHPVTFASLRANVQLNGRSNVTCLNIAISRVDSELRLSDFEEPSLNRVLTSGETANRELRVVSRRLQTLCCNLNIFPDFVKLDVEGHERAVLDGLGELKSTPKMIFVEGGGRPEIQEWMNQSGYTGPWFAHFRTRILSSFCQGRPEDPIFVHRRYLPELRKLGFNVVTGSAKFGSL